MIGRALAYTISRELKGDVALIERGGERHLENQSTRNSGVIHAGILYNRVNRPLKARFCVEGNAMLYELCKEHDIPHAACGKLVVAVDDIQVEYLDAVLEIAIENKVPGVRLVAGAELEAMQPNLKAVRALHVPTSGVIDAVKLLAKLRQLTSAHCVFETAVVGIEPAPEGLELVLASVRGIERVRARYVINAAGLYSDVIARMLDPRSPYTIFPVRGESARFTMTSRPELAMTGMNIYPTPCGFFHDGRRAEVRYSEYQRLLARREIKDTVGVHLTPTLDEHGQIAPTMTVGPRITTGIDRENVGRNLHPPEDYLPFVKDYFPNLRAEDLQLHQAGVQARLRDHLDWIIEPARINGRFINLIGIDSPGLTSSLAIARYVARELVD